jgi:hypothetical protein
MDDRAARAARRRATWTVTRGHAPERADARTAEERLASMWTIALDAWASSGRPLPQYSRAEMPGRFITLAEHFGKPWP